MGDQAAFRWGAMMEDASVHNSQELQGHNVQRQAALNPVTRTPTEMFGAPPPTPDEVKSLEPTPATPNSAALQLHNTCCTAQLFIRAAFAGLPRSLQISEQPDRLTPTLFAWGGIDAAAARNDLSRVGRRRIQREFLRERFGLSGLKSWAFRRTLERHRRTPHGREALSAGHDAMAAWLKGDDPSWRLLQLIEPPGTDQRMRKRFRSAPPSPRGGLHIQGTRA